MKRRILIQLAFILLVLQMNAQVADVLQRIRSAGKNVESFEATVTNVRQKKSGKTETQAGQLYFISPNEFAALFETGRYMIANEKQLKMDIGLFHGTFKLKEGGTMRALSNIFLYGFQGKCQELADENNYSVKVMEGIDYTVVLTNNKRNLLGIDYQQIIFHFKKDDLLIREFILIDTRGTRNTYTISNMKCNVAVSKDIFKT